MEQFDDTFSVSETLKNALRAAGIKQTEAARRTGTDLSLLNGFLNGKKPLSHTRQDMLARMVGLKLVRPKPYLVPVGMKVTRTETRIYSEDG